ncbi:MAG: Abhydrolase family protein [candidate division BRC1 bacterium ADurb.BinA292]|nr:MAG: Abhydrolase family protein [candidate division BRC1 bacterium ADurb.BinA292]
MTHRNFSQVEYFRQLAAAHRPRLAFDRAGLDFTAWRTALLAELHTLLGPTPASAALNPEIVWEIEEDGLIKRRVLLDFEPGMSAAALVYIPRAALASPAPAILCSHGHGAYGKDSVMGVASLNDPARQQEIRRLNYDYGLQMARRGFVTIAIDYRGFGERGDPATPHGASSYDVPYPGRDKCNVHFIRGSMLGFNLLALDIFDARRTLDYLTSLECVDAARIGAMGLSFGGVMTTWTALLDERIRAAAILAYSTTFQTMIATGNICGSQYLPGLYALCDLADLQGAIAPRPLLASFGTIDSCFAIDDALACGRRVRAIYAAAGAAERYVEEIHEGDHVFSGRKPFEFFDRHLGPAAPAPV